MTHTEVAQYQADGVADLGRRMKGGSGPLWELTDTIARAIYETRHPHKRWDVDRLEDQWLAVGTWRAAEAVVRVLPLAVKP